VCKKVEGLQDWDFNPLYLGAGTYPGLHPFHAVTKVHHQAQFSLTPQAKFTKTLMKPKLRSINL
jgi:hypothetical protein